MRNESVQLFFAPDSVADEALHARLNSLPGLRHYQFAGNLDGCWGAGAYTLDLAWDESAPVQDIGAVLTGVPGFERADAVTYVAVGGGVREPELRNGIWRTLMLRVRPEAGADRVAALERDLLRMPEYMRGIRNWRLARVISNSRWTHVWQQEYVGVGDLLGEYLVHPFHWGRVDRWFDPEFPEWTVDIQLSHAFCPLPNSLLAGRG